MKLISKKELANLLRASNKLNCLEARGGVDNWTWYGEALSDVMIMCGQMSEYFGTVKVEIENGK